MRWLCLQHSPFEGPGYLDTWARAHGHELAPIELWTGAPPPRVATEEGLIILGGPMNVYDHERCPWLAGEQRCIEAALVAGAPVLGICLGAQLLSVVLGGSVTRNDQPEIGWFPVELTPAGRNTAAFSGFPERFTPFHWHGDRFSIPAGAVHVARSAGCVEQAFVYGDRIVGLQFHLESTPSTVGTLVGHCGSDITHGPWIQDSLTMQRDASHWTDAHALLDHLLANLIHAAASNGSTSRGAHSP
jgi:GMP synthase-like glutamine amidotransferase